jgi:UDPglucose 6-dehydrogenase
MSSVVVIGDTHNAWVTAYCLAKLGHKITLISDDEPSITECNRLDLEREGVELIGSEAARGRGKSFDFAWIAHDTPLDKFGGPDVTPLPRLLGYGRYLSTRLVLSSQVPIGFCRRQVELYEDPIAYVPENMRIGDGVNGFLIPDRLVIGAEPKEFALEVLRLLHGLRSTAPNGRPETLLCSLETAEMIKHATNAFLATSVSFANEIAAIGRKYDVNMDVVTIALRADSRIGPKAYVEAGRPFTGGTLKRDLRALQIAAKEGYGGSTLIDAVLDVNDRLVGPDPVQPGVCSVCRGESTFHRGGPCPNCGGTGKSP